MGISLVFWQRTQQHMKATQLRDPLFLKGFSLAHPSITPSLPFNPFLEALPHTTLGRVRSVTRGVYLSVCVWAQCVCVCLWMRGQVRNNETVSETLLKQDRVENSRINPLSSSECSSLLQLLESHNKFDKGSCYGVTFERREVDPNRSWIIEY